jgi:TIR domain/SIR2-like domain
MNSTSRAAELWEEDVWPELLAYLDEGQVIPILGANWAIESEGRRISLEGYVATKLAERFSLPPSENGVPITLNDVVSRYLLKPGKPRRQALYPAILEIVERAQFAPPQPMLRLASITRFNLFVTTSFDRLLEKAIDSVRFNGKEYTQSIAYRSDRVHDIEASKADLVRPTVYHLFGQISAMPFYSICDNDLLECLSKLQSDSHRPARLFDELRDNHLLVLGGNFSDWLTRIFLRMIRRRPLSDSRNVLEILADDRSARDRELVFFLRNFSTATKVFPNGDAAQFTEELLRRWQERHPQTAQPTRDWMPPDDMAEGAVFISYTRQDLQAVQTIAHGLRMAGIDFWFDLNPDPGRGLTVGDEFDRKIRSCIERCSVFIAVMSRYTDAREESYFRREWDYAIDRSRGFAPQVPFLIPVVIDGTASFTTLPPKLAATHRIPLPEGAVTEQFAEQLRAMRRRP